MNKSNAQLEIQALSPQHINPNIPEGRHSFPFQIKNKTHLGLKIFFIAFIWNVKLLSLGLF